MKDIALVDWRSLFLQPKFFDLEGRGLLSQIVSDCYISSPIRFDYRMTNNRY